MRHVDAALPPSYWENAQQYLRSHPILAQLMDAYPESFLRGYSDPFRTLTKTIIGQQVSIASAESLWNRLMMLCSEGGLHPTTILNAEDESLRLCGISRQKRQYLKNVAEFFLHKERRDLAYWQHMTDDEVVAHIMPIKGIGRWSAEMFLIFCLQRPDIFPLADIGLQRALTRHFMITGKPFDMHSAQSLATTWQPYRTVALWYLWRSLDPIEVQY